MQLGSLLMRLQKVDIPPILLALLIKVQMCPRPLMTRITLLLRLQRGHLLLQIIDLPILLLYRLLIRIKLQVIQCLQKLLLLRGQPPLLIRPLQNIVPLLPHPLQIRLHLLHLLLIVPKPLLLLYIITHLLSQLLYLPLPYLQ